MELLVRGADGVVTPGLDAYIRERVAKLDHYLDRVVDAQMEVRRRHNRSGGDTTRVQLTIHTGRHLLRAEEEDHEARRAVDLAVDKMVRRIRRYHERRTERRRGRLSPVPVALKDLQPVLEPLPATAADLPDEDDAEEADVLVRVKRFSAKPMAADEAIDQMELLGHDFYLFQNRDEDQLNVVYRRRDGTYGLLAPDRA